MAKNQTRIKMSSTRDGPIPDVKTTHAAIKAIFKDPWFNTVGRELAKR